MKIYVAKLVDIDEEKVEWLLSFVHSEKRERMKNFINKKDKMRSIVGELLIGYGMEEELKSEIQNVRFEKNKYGKPYLKDYPEFQFNISHSGNFVVCAIDNEIIGIDIEENKPIEYVELARKFFTGIECDYIMKEDLNKQLSRFYQIWTLKESYIKCCGQGLSLPLTSFSIYIDQSENIKTIINNEIKNYQFKSFDIEQGYKMAVCSLKNEISTKLNWIDTTKLINGVLAKIIH